MPPSGSGPFLRRLPELSGGLARAVGDWRKPAWRLISPLVGEMSGRTEGGAVPPTCQRSAAMPTLTNPNQRGE
ncbi:MAG: hypothetical protein E5Y60_05195 [Mesorhizobium sp.]|nr:MAG: hypothetical protein E5Y60_05195 [Mesorhizobium sp.]